MNDERDCSDEALENSFDDCDFIPSELAIQKSVGIPTLDVVIKFKYWFCFEYEA